MAKKPKNSNESEKTAPGAQSQRDGATVAGFTGDAPCVRDAGEAISEKEQGSLHTHNKGRIAVHP